MTSAGRGTGEREQKSNSSSQSEGGHLGERNEE
jgi:hypothetical protein